MSEPEPFPLSPLPSRLLQLFFSPGALFQGLRERPVWGLVLLLGAVMVAVSVALIPVDLWIQMMREQAVDRGQDLPAGFGGAGPLFRAFSILGGVVGWLVMAFVLAGILFVIFAFLLGDEGRYTQYLSVVSHALFISAVGALLTVPLKIAQGDPTLTLSVGTFAAFLEEGYLFRVLKLLDLFGLWGYGVMAVGVSKIDPRRSLGSSMVVLFGLALVMALVFGIFGG